MPRTAPATQQLSLFGGAAPSPSPRPAREGGRPPAKTPVEGLPAPPPKARRPAVEQAVERAVEQAAEQAVEQAVEQAPSPRRSHAGAAAVEVVVGDLAFEEADALVSPAHTTLLGGEGLAEALLARAGPSVVEECRALRASAGGCRTGDAVVTSAGRLSARWLIHAVGPRWRGGGHGEVELLARAWRSALDRAIEVGARILALPPLSVGAYRFPGEVAARVALQMLARELGERPEAFDAVRLVVPDEATRGLFVRVHTEVFGEPGRQAGLPEGEVA